MVIIFWISATPYNIPGQRNKKGPPPGILQKRFASGQITNEGYQENKKILEKIIRRLEPVSINQQGGSQ